MRKLGLLFGLFAATSAYAESDPLQLRDTLLDDARRLLSEGNFKTWRDVHGRALAMKVDDRKISAGGTLKLKEYGDSLFDHHFYEEALAVREEVLAARRRADDGEPNDWFFVAVALNDLGRAHETLGDHQRAIEYFRQAVELEEGKNGKNYGVAINNLANAYANCGDLAAARATFERAVKVYESQKHTALWHALTNLASVLRRLHDFDEASRVLDRALAAATEQYTGDSLQTAKVLRQLAYLDLERRRPSSARKYAERALATIEARHERPHPDVADALEQVADVDYSERKYAEAKTRLERALAIRERVFGDHHLSIADTLTSLGAIEHVTSGPNTKQLYERALLIRRSTLGPNHPQLGETLRSYAWHLSFLGEKKETFKLALEAQRIQRAQFQLNVSALPQRQAFSMAGSDTRLDMIISNLPTRPIDNAYPATRRLVRDGIDELLRSRGLVLDEMMARQQLVASEKDPLIADLARRLRLARVRLASAFNRNPDASAIEALVRDRDQLERELAEHSAIFRRNNVGLDHIQAALPKNSAILSFMRFRCVSRLCASWRPNKSVEERAYYAAILIYPHADPRFLPLGWADEIEELVTHFRRAVETRPARIAAGAEARERAFREAGSALRIKVWDKIVEPIDGVDQLFIVPDAALHFVNFGTLPMEDGRFLLETGPLLHTLSAERDVVRLEHRPAKGQGLLIVSNPNFDEAAPSAEHAELRSQSGCEALHRTTWKALPGTEREAESIASAFRREPARTISGIESTESNFIAAARGRRILHLATHGYFFEGCQKGRAPNPLLLSGLVFAGANRSGAESSDDGFLSAEEIASLDLSGVEWAVLSACQTGLGQVQTGEGVLGLRRAFEIAGARTVISSLWAVNDQAAADWMRELYHARARGASTAKAMRKASLAIIAAARRAGRDPHPFVWGAFTASGDWR